MLSKEETQHIAKLARLGLGEAEIERYRKDLSSILGYMDKLKEVDIEGVKPFTHSVEIDNVFRGDEAIPCSQEAVNKLQDAFPEKKDGYLKVKSIF